MAKTPVRDIVIWTKHVHGDPALLARLDALPGGSVIDLAVNGVRGAWRKMADGKDGRSTRGIRPIGAAQAFWKTLCEQRRGEVVSLELAAPLVESKPVIYPPLGRTQEERDAAFSRFLAIADMGYSSEGRTMTRDEMHER